MKSRYGYNDNGEKIKNPTPPKFRLPSDTGGEWVIIKEGEDVPQIHREYIGDAWASPRRCHSTMTPQTACIWGSVRAFAKKVNKIT